MAASKPKTTERYQARPVSVRNGRTSVRRRFGPILAARVGSATKPHEPGQYLDYCNAALDSFLAGEIDGAEMNQAISAATRASIERNRADRYLAATATQIEQQPENGKRH